ncbi:MULTISPECIES: ABC transporter substrate-binding protein [Pacificibacter]|uniref:ABC transporter substrate-binding protein n=1 Tax=Pacificibacter TaxID=1042323 RepID=UPI002090D8F8|nr:MULTISPECIES: ABC transporter substrate-binding protein [Pacificibacter]MDO6615108.1 ABC transporter substrate-binding protein [Pacificibacter sp. 1_MG-2023]
MMLTRRIFTALMMSAAVMTPVAMTSPASAQELTKITFVSPSASAINSFSIHTAIGEGFFADEGLEVTAQAINGSGAVLQALSSGQADFGRPGPGPLLAARGRGVDAVFIYNHAAKNNFGLVVPDASPVQTPAELKGTVIGTGSADGAEVGFARNVMTGSGLVDGTDYSFLTVGDGGPASAGLRSGEISAYSAAAADAAVLNHRGVAVRDITPPEFARFFGNGLVTMGDTIRDNPELVEKFVRAVYRGHMFALDEANREAVLDDMAAANPQESEDREFANALLEAIMDRSIPTDLSHGYGYQPPEVWVEWQDVQIAGGELAEPLPDLTAAYTNEFTFKVNGSAN